MELDLTTALFGAIGALSSAVVYLYLREVQRAKELAAQMEEVQVKISECQKERTELFVLVASLREETVAETKAAALKLFNQVKNE